MQRGRKGISPSNLQQFEFKLIASYSLCWLLEKFPWALEMMVSTQNGGISFGLTGISLISSLQTLVTDVVDVTYEILGIPMDSYSI